MSSINSNIINTATQIMLYLLEKTQEQVDIIVKHGGPNYGHTLDLETDVIGPANVVSGDQEAAHKYGAVRVPEVDAARERLESEFPGVVCPTHFIYRNGLMALLAKGEIGAELERKAKWAINHSQFAAGINLGVGIPRVHAARAVKVGKDPEFEFSDPIAGVAICGELTTKRDGSESDTAYPDGQSILRRTREFMRIEYLRMRQNATWHKPGR